MKRAVIVLGAGASLEYGAPSTVALTHAIERAVLADARIKLVKADDAFKAIKSSLETYLQNPGIVHFEHIYHCAHELISTFAPTAGAGRTCHADGRRVALMCLATKSASSGCRDRSNVSEVKLLLLFINCHEDSRDATWSWRGKQRIQFRARHDAQHLLAVC